MFPTLFDFGPFSISTLWVFILISVYIFTRNLVHLLQKKRDDFRFIYENMAYFLSVIIIGARLGYVLENYEAFTQNIIGVLNIFAIWDNGFSFVSGMLCLLLALYFKTKEEDESYFKWLDYLTEPYMLVMPILFLGKFFDGMGYGSKTDLPIGITFSNMNVAIVTPVHPTQIYAMSLGVFAIFAYKKYFAKYKERGSIEGAKASFIIAALSTASCIEHLLRGDPTVEIFGIRLALIISFIMACCAVRYHIKLVHTNLKNNESL